jgi:septal ring factor EnvC (AmiA/AmiB activator)
MNLDSPATPATSLAPSLHDSAVPVDPKLLQQLDQHTKTIGEQAAMIKTLNKQLTHCESDLQTHMEEVARLENSLADSEKNRTFLSYSDPEAHSPDSHFQSEKRACMLLNWHANAIR